MATFNSMPTLSSGASPNDAMGGLNAAMTGSGLGIEGFDQDLNFDESMLDSVNHGLPPFTPTTYDFDTFSTTFEDPFNYPRPYEQPAPDHLLLGTESSYHPHHHDDDDEAASPQQLDDKLLSFSAPSVKATPLDDAASGQQQPAFSEVGMTAELYGMFFVAEDVSGGETAAATARPLELTCYRRNLWQCSGQITLPRHCTQVVNEQGRAVPIADFHASISAMESIEGKTTEIISIPWKSSSAGGNGNHHQQHPALGESQETKVAGAPPKIALDLSGGQDVDGHRVSIPVAWKRLQFKSATANNGRRKGLQQHYVVQINLLGRMRAGGEFMKIAEIRSGPVIVRGRSPRNFDSRKDVPLSADKKPSASAERGLGRAQSEATTPGASLKQERTDVPSQNLHRYHSLGSTGTTNIHPTPSGSNDWTSASTPTQHGSHQQQQQQAQHASKKLAISPNLSRPPVPAWGNSSSSKTPTLGQHSLKGSSSQISLSSTSLPINLSLSEDERSPNTRAGSDALQSPRLNRSGTAGHGGGGAGSPSEEMEQLYEYFPLSVDDWTPPVDTIYRPHIVHHIAIPQEIKAQKVRSKAKRYFSAE